MIDVDKAVVAKLNSGGGHFEVLVDCELALVVKAGGYAKAADALAVPKVFSNARKVAVAHASELLPVFGTADPVEIAKRIILDGEIQLTSKCRQRIMGDKRKRIVDLIHLSFINPATGIPHPKLRIELAMKEAGVRIDEYTPEKRQVKEIVSKLKMIIPLSQKNGQKVRKV